MTEPQQEAPVSVIGPTKEGIVAVVVGDPKAPIQQLVLPVETWWMIMGTITKNSKADDSSK